MADREKQVVVHAPLTQGQRDEMGAILDRLLGTPIERTGDIAIEIGGKRHVFGDQSGDRTAASVARDGGTEIIRSRPPYRREEVLRVVDAGLAVVPDQATGKEFTLREISPDWGTLSDVEQRNAGKRFLRLIEAGFPGRFDSWKTSDNERHYRRR